MDSKTIRYQNVRYLVEDVGGVSNFAEKISKGQSQTSQFAGSTPIKGIGNKIAREIEKVFGKEHGWLDVYHPELFDDRSNSSTSLKEVGSVNLQQLVSTFEEIFKRIEILYGEKKLDEHSLGIIESVTVNTLESLIDSLTKNEPNQSKKTA